MVLLGRIAAVIAMVVFGALWAFGGHHWAWWPWEASLVALVFLNATVWYQQRKDEGWGDGPVMRWWVRLRGPSKSPEDYR
jgi:hypothetical protein